MNTSATAESDALLTKKSAVANAQFESPGMATQRKFKSRWNAEWWFNLNESQAQLARDLGRSRASVHSAISVLRERGILSQSGLELAPHLNGLTRSNVDYPWLDIRIECS